MSERPSVFGLLPNDGDILTTSEYLQTAETLRVHLFYISNQRRDIITDRIWGAPDMVLEVMSPNPRIGDVQERVDWFCEYGVHECWLGHQLAREIEVLQLDRRRVLSRRTFRGLEPVESTVLPFFGIAPEVLTGW
ncbi:MAG: Uma2 family endonuclease [Acidobacteriota bacterium]|nr:Uma2 family endonuclease [Acidobacteriota bacterium]